MLTRVSKRILVHLDVFYDDDKNITGTPYSCPPVLQHLKRETLDVLVNMP